MAKTRLDRLLPHYDPRLIIDDDLDDPDDPEEGTEASKERIFWNPKRLNNLTDGFRIFTNRKLLVFNENAAPPARRPRQNLSQAISFAGATTRGGEENAAAGAGYWIDEV
jgi:hypothetical protein